MNLVPILTLNIPFPPLNNASHKEIISVLNITPGVFVLSLPARGPFLDLSQTNLSEVKITFQNLVHANWVHHSILFVTAEKLFLIVNLASLIRWKTVLRC